MDKTIIIDCLEQSVAEFNITSEGDLINLVMKYIDELHHQETASTLVHLRASLKDYGRKTNHVHDQSIGELVFKIDGYLAIQPRQCI
ncbi:hypothetical protein [Companilactobacillus mishanensis]|uniref:hypothetical protein n=1 Tax=Companilactobacillus mishanensis TaxID=2486008 RepID=UPI001296D84C|nr:hypothetical protein [Companilactobacillus mishanensis]MQS89648.1 hypothetical protein [Companilactobacillus mishanensis]